MTRLSTYFLPTEKQAPADAEAPSHKLMVRAGLARQLGSGLWTWLPAGWRVHRAAEQIVREELDAIGAQEMLMPVINPAEIWQRSGRYDIEELFKLKDRRGADLVLAMTHEEVVTTHVAPAVRSYRDLPFSLYHFQTKGRDEPRPRAGVLRTREFIMKDAYTFDRDREGLDAHYERYREAYDRIFDRVGLEWYRVEADVGMMGGVGAHEYMAPSPAGENDVALAPGYAANVEVASAQARPVALPDGSDAPVRIDTPGLTTVAEVAQHQHVEPGTLLKAYPVIVEDRGLTMVVVRGDHRVNDIKLANTLGTSFRPAREDEFAERIGPAGYIGPVGIDVPILLDDAVEPGAYITGANRDNSHFKSVEPGRDFPFKRGDVRRVEAGDTVDGHEIRVEPAIEVGNIFKLGTRFSEPLGATYLDESGTARPIWMGSYGIGPARISAAAIEQHADEQGISWPRALAPFDIHLVGLGKAGSEERELAERVYGELLETGLRILYDDRDAGPGEKFADAELLGVPVRLTVGRRTLESGEVEVQVRRGRHAHTIPLEGAATAAADLWRTVPLAGGAERARLTFRRLTGLDRSGPSPPQIQRGQPLHPWTIPNAIDYVRLALIPVFLVIAFSSGDGQDWRAVLIFAIVGWSDYLDGIAARLTGQYSRLGALLDPLIDRLLVLSGAVVCWHFELLPRWGLALLAAREVFMLGLVRWGMRHGADIKVNWFGRLGIWPVLGALFFAMAGLERLGEILLYIGLALVFAATAKYVREGLVSRPSSTG